MVSRILMNSVYCGTERYPRIVSDKQFDLAVQVRESKSVTYSPVLKYFRKEMQCGGCGARLYWHTKSNQWFCRQCGMWSKPIQAEELSNSIVEKLEWLRQNTGQLRAAENIGNLQSIELARLNREIRLADEESDADEIILKIIHRAELQYEFCSAENADPETMRIRNACIRHAELSGDFPDKFYNETVSKVILYRDTHIEIELQNGQVI